MTSRLAGFVLCAVAVGCASSATDDPTPGFGLIETAEEPPPKGAMQLGEVAFKAALLYAAHFPADGKTILAGLPEEIREWNLDTKAITRRYRLEGVVARELTSTPDGRFLVVRDLQWVYVLTRADGKLAHKFRAEEGDTIDCFAVSPDGKTVAVGTRLGRVALHELATGKALPFQARHPKIQGTGDPFRRIEDFFPMIAHVAFAPDGKTIASAGLGDIVRAWDVATAKAVWALDPATSGGSGFAFSPDGKSVLAQKLGPEPNRQKKGASAPRASGYAIWSVAERKPVVELEGTVWGGRVAFSPDGKTVATGDATCRFQVWDAATGKAKFTMSTASAISAVEFSRDGKLVACACGSFELRDAATGRDVQGEKGHSGAVGTAAVSGDGKLVVTGGSEGTVRVWDAATGKPRLVVFHGQGVKSVAIAPDGATFASVGSDSTARVWSMITGKELLRLESGTDLIGPVAFSPDGRLVGVGGNNLTTHLFDATTGKPRASLVGYDGYRLGGSSSFRFSPDGKHIAAPVCQGPGGGKARFEVPDPPMPVERSAFDPALGPAGEADGKYRVALWDVTTGQRVRLVGPPVDSIPGYAFSREGDLIAVCGYGAKEVEVVSVKTGAVRQRVGVKDAHEVEFAPDGGLFVGRACYDLDTGEVTTRLPDRHWLLAVTPDGRRAVVWGREAVWLWPLSVR